MTIKDRVALITGSASGMGKQIAMRMAEGGAKVIINDIAKEKVSETVTEFKAKGFDVLGIVTDITKKEAVDAMVADAVKHFGSMDILVNNAGMEKAGALRNSARRTGISPLT
jgi:NAD(P)-dependent dehydrogenase (short-subunit alcohol dehydrogenase family)